MSFFERWFGGAGQDFTEPDVPFGRYSDSYKPDTNHQAWDQSLAAFEVGDYLTAYRHFLLYLRDETDANVRWEERPDALRFEFYQGSKRITGQADHRRLRIEAKIAKLDQAPRIKLLRRLIERNYTLRYGRYAIDDERCISLIFDTYTLDASPYKLYYALKEVATSADKLDDLLLEEFWQLEAVEASHLQQLPEAEQTAKYGLIQRVIHEALRQFDAGDTDKLQYPGGVAYLLLDALYRIDYLTKPEGHTMEALEWAHRQYFAKDSQQNAAQKNEQLANCLRNIANRPEADVRREMYRGISTFGITLPVTHERVAHLIDNEMPNLRWYHNNGHPAVARAVAAYVIGYCLFNYAVPEPDRDFFHLYYRIAEPLYFQELGFRPNYCDPATGQLDRREIRRAIERIAERFRDTYPRLRPALNNLVFDDLIRFSESYLLMIRDLNFDKSVAK